MTYMDVGDTWVLPRYGPPVAAPPSTTPVNTAQYPTNPGSAAWPSYAARFGQDFSPFQTHYFYQDNPNVAYAAYMNFLDPNPNSAFSRYAAQARERLYQQYLNQQSRPGHVNDLWTDFLGGRGNQLQTEFGGLGPQARGEHPLQFSRWLA